MIEKLCNVNGVIVPEAEAVVPVMDRGFLFGDSVYEVIRTRGGVPFTWREHLARLRRSAAAIRLELDLDDRSLMERVTSTLAAARSDPGVDAYIRIVVTRGTGSAPNIDLRYADGPPTTILFVRPLPPMTGVPTRLALVPRLRNDRRALDPAVKSGNYLNNVLGLAEAQAEGSTDCLFFNAEGRATEASTANVYIFERGQIATPPVDAGLLPGITREVLRNCCEASGIKFGERHLTRGDLEAAEEVFLSSTGRDLSPVTHVDGRALHDGGKAGPRTAELMRSFTEFCDDHARAVDAPALRHLLA